LINELVARVLKDIGIDFSSIRELTGVKKEILDRMLGCAVSEEAKKEIVDMVNSGEASFESLAHIVANATNTWEKEYFDVNFQAFNEDKREVHVITIADLHEPYGLRKIPEFLDGLYGDEKNRKILVIGGDVFHADIVDTRKDSQDDEVFKETYTMALNEVTELSSIFDDIYMIIGNHDEFIARMMKKSKSRVAVSFMLGDPIGYLAGGYEFYNVPTKTRDHSNVHYGGTAACKLGDVIFMHPNNYSKYVGKMAIDSSQYWLARDRSIRAIVSAHTHRQGTFNAPSNIHYGECGCMMGRFDHISRKLVTTKSVPDIGFAELWLDENLKYIPNSYRNYQLNDFMRASGYYKNFYDPKLELER
jgi:hypothetical protein